MTIGCLTGNGKRSSIDGTYGFNAPGVIDPLAPDLSADRTGGAGPFSFCDGALTDGDDATGVGWRAITVGEAGVDIAIDLGAPYFVDRVVLHPPKERKWSPRQRERSRHHTLAQRRPCGVPCCAWQ